MKRLFSVVWALALLALTAGPVLAQAEPVGEDKPKAKKPKPKKPKSGLRGEYAIMASKAGFTDEQKTKLKALVKEMNEAVRKEAEASKEKLAELKKAIEAAKKAKDKAAGQEARKKMAEVKKASQAVKAGYQKKIVKLMTAEQRGKWGAFVFYRKASGKFSKAKLTDDQKKAVRTLCDAAAKELGDLAISASAKEDKKKVQAAVKKASEQISRQVLTDEQRKAMKAKAKGKDKPAKPKD